MVLNAVYEQDFLECSYGFQPPRGPSPDGTPPRSESFDLLGSTHYWGKSRRGKRVMKRKTAKARLRSALVRIGAWCATHRHDRVSAQRRVLARKMRGHYAYHGITGNYPALQSSYRRSRAIWRFWLNRRSQRRRMPWPRLERLERRHPLPPPRVVHSALTGAAKP